MLHLHRLTAMGGVALVLLGLLLPAIAQLLVFAAETSIASSVLIVGGVISAAFSAVFE